MPSNPIWRAFRAVCHAFYDVRLLAMLVAGEGRGSRKERYSVIRLTGPRRRIVSLPLYRSLALMATTAFISRPVLAQEWSGDNTPDQLFLPEEGTGVQLGSNFRLFPTVQGEADYDSNIYNVDSGKRADAIFILRPEARISSDFARHYLELRGGAEIRRYADNSGENAEAYHIDALSRLELGGHIDVVPEAGYARGFERRGTAGDQFFSDEPIIFRRKYLGLQLSRTVGLLGLSADGRVTTLDYSDATIGGVPIDLSDRDVTVRVGHLRASYRLSEGISAFAEAGLNEVDYRTPVAQQRNSNGYSTLAGLRAEPSPLLSFEVAAGYLHQGFDNPAYKDVSDIDYRLSAKWTPRRTWSVRAEVRRDVDPSPRVDTPAIIRSEFLLGAQHSVGDRLLLESEAATTTETYQGIDRTDRYFRIDASARYRVNRNVGVTARIGYRTQGGDTAGRNYDGVYAGVGVSVVL